AGHRDLPDRGDLPLQDVGRPLPRVFLAGALQAAAGHVPPPGGDGLDRTAPASGLLGGPLQRSPAAVRAVHPDDDQVVVRHGAPPVPLSPAWRKRPLRRHFRPALVAGTLGPTWDGGRPWPPARGCSVMEVRVAHRGGGEPRTGCGRPRRVYGSPGWYQDAGRRASGGDRSAERADRGAGPAEDLGAGAVRFRADPARSGASVPLAEPGRG